MGNVFNDCLGNAITFVDLIWLRGVVKETNLNISSKIRVNNAGLDCDVVVEGEAASTCQADVGAIRWCHFKV